MERECQRGTNTVKHQVFMLQFFEGAGPTCLLSYTTSENEDLFGKCLTLNKEPGRNCLLKWLLKSVYNFLYDAPRCVHYYPWKPWNFVLLSHPGAYISFNNVTMHSICITC